MTTVRKTGQTMSANKDEGDNVDNSMPSPTSAVKRSVTDNYLPSPTEAMKPSVTDDSLPSPTAAMKPSVTDDSLLSLTAALHFPSIPPSAASFFP